MIHRYIIEATDEVKGFEKAIERLDREWGINELEPCNDCISRAEAEAIFKNARKSLYELSRKEQVKDFQTREMMLLNAEQFIHLLPSVAPQPKIGHWIMKHRSYSEMKYLTGTDEMGIEHTVKKHESYEIDEPYCSECGKRAGDTSLNFCPNCGADMRGDKMTNEDIPMEYFESGGKV